ncbi:LLM class flavin-dependent oxidoreductase [Nocardioides nitrophenolicus]|uniref:LLM class flavin-dependent oxidoreductase n=1 Tax=Nocardioides nitrophenolicus TaxID=60489 RepID=UPI00195E9578|nr:LLM class flavin-dependent oxidoreductase [Nocardioides nitrophenolicus]MBM7517981.1 alkanesulfonate monooxygenase SsuD/methylene tetrahydromethanopterin reductase-like flavin-dependent oxidoreductase (luciferase family) [Nocardioides nitrophenolicus]
MTSEIQVGIALNDDFLEAGPAARRSQLAAMEAAGLDHLTVGDHISFHGGKGFDGFVAATAALATSDTLKVLMGVYLVGLRHPLATARQLATLSQLAPGRLTLGVGVAGEDRTEVANMGVDPATRGRRVDETLAVLRRLASGEVVDHDGEFYRFEGSRILPPPDPRVPIVIGGGGDVAVRRTVRYGDGWLGMWCSARRYAQTHQQLLDGFAESGRGGPTFAGLNIWVGLGADAGRARTRLGERMSALYNLPPEKFQHVSAAGTPDDVADFVASYVEAGARTITLIPVADSADEAIALSGEVRTRLRSVAAGS